MKRLIFIGVTLALVLGLLWVPAVAAVEADITIHKTIEEGCPPDETFHFEAWRDMNMNGVIDAGDTLQGTVDITGEDTGVITVGIFGLYIIHEEPVSGWEPNPDQSILVSCDVDVYFHNSCVCTGQIRILKVDREDNPLGGATFEICPNPKTGEMPCLTVEDNGINDEDPADGVLLVTGVKVCVECNVTEIEAPEGYELDPVPQPAHVTECEETVVLKFVNIEKEEYGQIEILKVDQAGNLITAPGACFEITPDPRTCEGSLELCDNIFPDEDPAFGVLFLSECLVCCECTVTETQAPEGYELDSTPQPAHVTVEGETVTLTFENRRLVPDICIEKLVDCNDDGVYLPRDTGYYGDTPSWYIRVWNCGETPLLNVMVSDTNGMNWGPFDLDVGEEWEVTYEGDPIFETTTNTAEAIAEDGTGATVGPVYASATNVITPPSCGTVCAAQTAPGEFLFSDEQDNWFTWIYYDIGDGTADVPYTYPIYTGQTHLCGTLYVYDDGTHIFVNYVLTDMNGCTAAGLSEYHLQVDASFDDLYDAVVKKKNPIPGKCEYKDAFDPMVSETGWIEAVDDDISGWTTAWIFAHGVGCYYCP